MISVIYILSVRKLIAFYIFVYPQTKEENFSILRSRKSFVIIVKPKFNPMMCSRTREKSEGNIQMFKT